jgi:hypothetical protein
MKKVRLDFRIMLCFDQVLRPHGNVDNMEFLLHYHIRDKHSQIFHLFDHFQYRKVEFDQT